MRYWLLCGALVLGGVAGVLHFAPDAPAFLTALRGYPFVLLAAVVLLSWRFARSRLAWAALIVAAAYLAAGAVPPSASASFFGALSLLAPLALAGLALGDDRGLPSSRGLMQLSLALGLPAALLLIAALPIAPLEPWLARLHAQELGGGVVVLSRPALLAFLAGAALVGAMAWRRHRPTEVGLFYALAALLFVLEATPGGPERPAWLLAAGAVLALAVVESTFALAYHDELTGLPARRALREATPELAPPYAVAVVDVDHFKKVNDRHGHDTGDQVLRMVAAKLAKVKDGRAYRTGGEEFTLLFPGLDAPAARERVEWVRELIADSPFHLRAHDRPARRPPGARREEREAVAVGRAEKKSKSKRARRAEGRDYLKVTVSAGVAAATTRDAQADAVIAEADRALYRAKRGGRNRTVAGR